MHSIRAIAASLCFTICGCASAYEVPGSLEAVRKSLDPTRAEALLADGLSRSDGAHGLCGSDVLLDKTSPTYIELKNGVMIFEEYARKGRDPDVARDFPSLDRRRDRFEFDFRSVSQIRVLSAGVVSPICAGTATNRQLGLKDGHGCSSTWISRPTVSTHLSPPCCSIRRRLASCKGLASDGPSKR
jgi:hypothetical protein